MTLFPSLPTDLSRQLIESADNLDAVMRLLIQTNTLLGGIQDQLNTLIELNTTNDTKETQCPSH